MQKDFCQTEERTGRNCWIHKADDVFTYTPGMIKYDAKINKNNIISAGIRYKNL
jgi:hypothetical protein